MSVGDVTVFLHDLDGNAADITAQCADVEWTTEDPGGFGTATVDLDRPLLGQGDVLAAYSRMRITDQRTAAVLFEGFIQDPGRSSGTRGQVWSLSALGAASHAKDHVGPYVVVDRNLTHFDSRVPDETLAAGTVVEIATDNADNPSMRLSLDRGADLATNTLWGKRWLAGYQAGQRVARVDWSQVAGKDEVSYTGDARLTEGLFGGTALADSQFFFTTSQAQVGIIGSDWSAATAYDVVDFYVESTYVGAVPDDDTWLEVTALCVRTALYTKAGVLQTTSSAYSTTAVYDYEVVGDLLGSGRLPLWDGANATIATTGATAITQLAYLDPVTPAKVFEDLIALDRTRTWAVWERKPTGLWRFEWTIRPTAVDYELDANVDELTVSGSSAELYNRVAVRWKDGAGRTQTTIRTQTVDALDAVGLERTALLDIGEDLGIGTAATLAGDEFLTDHQYPTRGGSIVVSRPRLNMRLSRVRHPREFRAGCLVRVRNAADKLAGQVAATSPDGAVVWRVIRTTYSTKTGAATLELGQYEQTVERVIAATAKALDQRRRS